MERDAQLRSKLVSSMDRKQIKSIIESLIFVSETPITIDAIQKVITLTARVCEECGISGWRQSNHNIKKMKRLYRQAQQLKRSRASTAERVQEKQRRIQEAHRQYTNEAQRFVEKASS